VDKKQSSKDVPVSRLVKVSDLFFFNLGLPGCRVQLGYGALPGENQISLSKKLFQGIS
jgi:hypothetical protein